MKRLLAALLFAAALLTLTACGGTPPAASHQEPGPSEQQTPGETPDAAPEENSPEKSDSDALPPAIQALLDSMSLAEKVGQLFFVRCPADSAREDVSTYHLGGYLLFGRDFKDKTAGQIIETVAAYQAAADLPLLIGVDEEGGTVVRVSANPNLRSAKFPSPQKLYAAGGLDAILQDTAEKDRLLASLGINVNFAPVADVSTSPGDFIYSRSFGQDAAATENYVSAVVTRMALDGMGSVMKHFPGYGNNADTHTGIAVDTRPLEQFIREDFQPFLAGVDCGCAENGHGSTTSVLVSHNIVQCMDPDLPASLSPAVHQVLRETLSFDGVVMTDDLAMDAVSAYAEDGAVAVMALQAGNDMVVTTDYRNQIPKVVQAVEGGTLDEAVIDGACLRVLRWKQALGLLEL
jgi:beta-N-acetylhexosaminidase